MKNEKISKFLGFIAILLIIPLATHGEETEKTPVNSNYTLTINDNLISLDAQGASVKEVVEEIGRRMDITVISEIPDGRRVTVKFEGLTLEAAIERLRDYADIAYIKESEDKDAKVTKILVFEKGKGTQQSKLVNVEERGEEMEETGIGFEEVVGEPDQAGNSEGTAEGESEEPEPFKFEFDPSQYEGD
jgi:hypothetical protein